MDVKNMAFTLVMLFLFTFIEANHSFFNPIALNNAPSSTPSYIILPLHGYLGLYTVTLNIGNPPEPFALFIDSGSSLTWVECEKPPSTNYHTPNQAEYKTHGNIVACGNPVCAPIPKPYDYHGCVNINDQCDYFFPYEDGASSRGVLVQDTFHLEFTDNYVKEPSLFFGCGYKQAKTEHDNKVGTLALGNVEYGILPQLQNLGLIKNVFGHCLREEGGFIFIGDRFTSEPGIVWTPMLHRYPGDYTLGPVDIFFNGEETSVKDLEFIFDSGFTSTYLNEQAYEVVVDLVTNDLKETPLETTPPLSHTLVNCWKLSEGPIKSLNGIKEYFKPITLVFRDNVQLQLQPENYLYHFEENLVCLGIFNSSAEGLSDRNYIGAISFQNKLMVYDNERKEIGWLEDCPDYDGLHSNLIYDN